MKRLITITLILALLVAMTLRLVFPSWSTGLVLSGILFVSSGSLLVLRFAYIAAELSRVPKPGRKQMGVIRIGLFVIAAWCLLGVFFAWAYGSAAASDVSGREVLDDEGVEVKGFWELVYFSIITGSTTGFGDICPHGALSRFIACGNIVTFWLMFCVGIYMLQETLHR